MRGNYSKAWHGAVRFGSPVISALYAIGSSQPPAAAKVAVLSLLLALIVCAPRAWVAQGVGWTVAIQCFAIGGLKLGAAGAVRATGAVGMAVVSALDPEVATRALLAEWEAV